MDLQADTIAAIATAPGEAGIAIVRLSGPRCLAIADRIFRCHGRPPSERPANTFVHGTVRGGGTGDGVALDECVLLVFRAPHSYTGDDVVELQGHGGRTVSRRVLQAALHAGARLAEPGEFTRRAFLNGRMDLVQAEAVADLIRARSDRAAAAAMEQLHGSLSRAFDDLYDHLMQVDAEVEATLDFVEDELPEAVFPALVARLDDGLERMAHLLATWEEGHLLREGALIVISGQPNVGKSTLMNLLLGSDRAIVSDTPGTTRDTIEEQIILGGIPARLIDTAGLREADCHIEREGIRRAQAHMAGADVNVHVVDASRPIDRDERARLARLNAARTVLVQNKADLGILVDGTDLPQGVPVVTATLVTGKGLEAVRHAIQAKLDAPDGPAATPHAVISERHRVILDDARRDIGEARDLLATGREDQIVLAAASLRAGLERLGEATGRAYSQNLLDTVFSSFCIGK